MSLKVQNLTKKFGSQTAVNNISFEVATGELVGFLGPNGAGKSTTMKLITGYLQADAGTILVDGIDVAKDPIGVKKRIGYLPEANPLYLDMFVREYLSFIAGVHKVKDAKGKIEKVIETVGLKAEAHKKLGQLSKGYKQRAGLAAALLHDPQVLILDEPTSGLDPNQIVEIRNVVKALAKTKTVLLSSHIMQEVEAICDRIIVINLGKIVADDSIENLRSGGKNAVVVTFNKAVDESELGNLEAAGAVSVLGQNKYSIETPDAATLRRSLLEFSINKNINIDALQNQSTSLETVFKSLTKSH